jgi:catechol 2,3-dioxygenase-like lactoylglutathione lyase family enzyme
MPKLYGPMMQNCFVVRDLDAAIRFWTGTMQVGPFFRFPPLEFSRGELHGKPHIPQFGAAITYSGDLMIELIEPRGPSIFQEFLDAGGTGVHHNCVMTDDFDAAEADFLRRGGERLQFQADATGSVMSYVLMPGVTPVIVEVAQLIPEVGTLFGAIRAAAAGWDGQAPELVF